MDELITTEQQAIKPLLHIDRLDQNPAIVYLSRLGSDKSRRSQRGALETIARMVSQGKCGATDFAWTELRYQHTVAIRSMLASRYAPATANKILSALRGVLEEAWRLGLVPVEDFRRAADVKNVKSRQLPTGRAIAGHEIAALLQVCVEDESPAGVRDAAMLGVLRSGLRREEVVNLDVSDIDLQNAGVKVRGGKGNKDRMVFLTEGAIASLNRWLELRGFEAGPLFLPINKGGRVGDRRMVDESVRTILQKRMKQAGVEHFSPHDWRRTFVSDLLDAGADLSTVQQLAGHANPATTARYDRRGDAAKRRAVNLLK